jgi:hypothetical protein
MRFSAYVKMPNLAGPGVSASRWGFAHETAATALATEICVSQADKRNAARHTGNVWPLSPSGASSG